MTKFTWNKARFPVVFGGFVAFLCVGFINRHKFWPDMDEQRRLLMLEDAESRKALEEAKREFQASRRK